MNVATELANAVGTGIGLREMPAPMPKVMTRDVTPEVTVSGALSLFARPGDGSIAARRVAILVADGCDAAPLIAIADRLTREGAVPRFISTKLGAVEPSSGDPIEVDVSFEATPSVLYDAAVVPGGADAIAILKNDGRTLEFLKDQYRHCKPTLVFGDGIQLLEAAGIPTSEPDPGLIVTDGEASDAFVAAIARHRHFERETDPPRV
jgi:catalase